MYILLYLYQKATNTIPLNTQKKNIEIQESVIIISDLSTQKSRNLQKKIHNLHHISSLFMELFVMRYPEAFVTLTTVILVHCSKIKLSLFFFFFWWSCSKLLKFLLVSLKTGVWFVWNSSLFWRGGCGLYNGGSAYSSRSIRFLMSSSLNSKNKYFFSQCKSVNYLGFVQKIFWIVWKSWQLAMYNITDMKKMSPWFIYIYMTLM